MKKTACYVRVSTDLQTVESQRREIQLWLDGHNVTDVEWFIDEAKSGATLNRPEFERLQKSIFNGEVKTVVVYKLDRLSRSLRDGLNTLIDWCERGVRVVSTSQQIDFNGTMGKLIASVLFAVAEMEREVTRERQAAGIAAAKERGVYFGRKRGTMKSMPTRAQELRAKGLKDHEIATALGISRRTVQRYVNTIQVA